MDDSSSSNGTAALNAKTNSDDAEQVITINCPDISSDVSERMEANKVDVHVPENASNPATEKPERKTQYPYMEIFATFVAAFSFFCTGLTRAYASPALASLEKDIAFLNTTEIPTKDLISWIASSTPLASFFGTILSGPTLQYCGRQKTILLLALPFIAGWVLIGFSKNLWMVLAGRAFTGISTGLSTAAAQLYVSECVRPQVRGSFGFLPSMMLALGILVGFGIGATDIEWQTLSLVMTIFPLMLLGLSSMAPESPPWLLLQKREDKALKSLVKLRGKHRQNEVDAEFKELIATLSSSHNYHHGSDNDIENVSCSGSGAAIKPKKPILLTKLAKLLNQRKIWLPTFISVSLMSLQQLCGVNAIIYYISVIIERSRTEMEGTQALLDANMCSVIVGTVQFLAFFVSLPLIDRVGRRILLLTSAFLMALSHGSLALYFYFKDQSSLESHHSFVENTFSWFPLTCLSCFIAAYSIGFGPVPFIIMSEIFPSNIRSYLCSLSSLVNHLFLFLVIFAFPFLLDGITPTMTFLMMSILCLIAVAFVTVFVPETKGKSLSEIEIYFSSRVNKDNNSNCNGTNL